MSCSLGPEDFQNPPKVTRQLRRKVTFLGGDAKPEMEPDNEDYILHLMRGGCIIPTKIGPIQYGMPPETVKDSINLGIEVPTHYIIPSRKFTSEYSLNVAEFEFPAYFNFFLKNRKINLICTPEDEKALRTIFQETLLGPLSFENLNEDFYHTYDKEAYPDFYKELSFFSRNPTNLNERLTIDTLLSFTLFDPSNNEALVEEIIRIKKKDGFIFVYQNGREIAKITDEVKVNLPVELLDTRGSGFSSLYSHQTVSNMKKNIKAKKKLEKIRKKPGDDGDSSNSSSEEEELKKQDQERTEDLQESPMNKDKKNRPSFVELFIYEEDLLKSSFQPPAFGVTVVGCSHGFDPKGSTSGYIVWINGRGIMVDPPPFTTHVMKKMGIPSILIDAVILSHCHADHDAGIFQKILDQSKVELITTRTILNSFMRKYSALTGIATEELRQLFIFRPALIGASLSINGARFQFFYSFHPIPCIGFEVFYKGKSLYFSGDHFFDPGRLLQLKEQGIISEKRYSSLVDLEFKHDLILHEAGVPPIHTPQKTLANLSDDIKRRLYLVHVAEKDVMKDSGLKAAKAGVQNTIVLIDKLDDKDNLTHKIEILSRIDIFESVNLRDIVSLLDVLKEEKYPPHKHVVMEGDVANKFFVLKSGICKIYSDAENKKFERYCQIGDYFGETSLLPYTSMRQASVIAVTELELYSIEKQDFLFIFGDGLGGSGPVIQKLYHLIEVRKSDAITILFKNKTLSGLKPQQKTQLEMIINKKLKASNKDFIWKQESEALGAYLIHSGVYQLTDTNKGEIVELSSGAFLIDMFALKNSQPNSTKLTCKKEGHYFLIEKDDILNFVKQNPGLSMKFSEEKYIL